MLRYAFALCLWASPALADEGGVRGVVVDAETRAPVAGASVLLPDDRAVVTAADGSFELPARPAALTVVSGEHEPTATSSSSWSRAPSRVAGSAR
jgi:hypothetical protein